MRLTKKEEIEQLRGQVRALGQPGMSGDEALALVEEMVPMVLGEVTEDFDDAMIHVLRAALKKKR
jgi:hypothetical protein